MQNGATESGSAKVGHPVYPLAASPQRIGALKEAVAPLMGMDEAEMVGLAPDRTGFRFMDAPIAMKARTRVSLSGRLKILTT